MKKQKLICVLGESGSGKDTLIRLARSICTTNFTGFNLNPVVSFTTRPKRDNETNNVEHIFVTKEEAHEIMNNSTIVAYTKIEDPNSNTEGYEYFTTLEYIKTSNVYIIDPKGLEYLKTNKDFNEYFDIISIYIHTPKFLRSWRARKRSDYKTSYRNRVLNESKQFENFRKNHLYDYKINNLSGLQYFNAKRLYKIAKKFLLSNYKSEGDHNEL